MIDGRLGEVVDNKKRILGTTRNLEFFTTGYRYLIQARRGRRATDMRTLAPNRHPDHNPDPKPNSSSPLQILPVLVVAPLFFAGQIELGVISQSSGAFNHVLNDLSLIVNEFESLSSFSAGLNRLATFVGRMEALAPDAANGSMPFNLSAAIAVNATAARADAGAPAGALGVRARAARHHERAPARHHPRGWRAGARSW